MSDVEGTHVVTIVQRFPHVTKPMERHEVAGPRVRAREVPRSEMRSFLAETLEDMERAVCEFQFCPGPDKPTQAMRTCFVCYRVKRLRVMLGWLAGDVTHSAEPLDGTPTPK